MKTGTVGATGLRRSWASSALAALMLAIAAPLANAASGPASPAAAPADGRSGKAVAESVCLNCHRAGLLGAPKINDAPAWRERATKGLSALTSSAMEGLRKMPDHGGDPNLTELELGRAITYMVNQSGGTWVEPATPGELAQARPGEAIVTARCASCHATGVGGAPKIGDAAAWAGRARNGLDELTMSAIRGHGGMPSRGGLTSASDAELRAAVTYMFNPAAASAQAGARAGNKSKKRPAPDSAFQRTVAGMDINLGIVSSAKLEKFPADSPERKMHGGIPAGRDQHHISVTVLNHNDGKPIADANVKVNVDEPGISRITKQLAPVVIGVPFYGGYVPLAEHLNYRISVEVLVPGASTPAVAQFQYRNN